MRLSTIFLGIASITVYLVATELILRLWYPLPDPYQSIKSQASGPVYIPSTFSPNLRLEVRAEEGLPGMTQEKKTFSTNNRGFRGDSLATPKPNAEFRIFMVGGSTTETLYLDDSEAITRVLQDQLNTRIPGSTRVAVYGAGKSGDASYDHLAMIAHRIVHLQPDLIIAFLGFNDLRAAVRGVDYTFYRGPPGQRPDSDLVRYLKFLMTEFQIPRLLHAAAGAKSDRERLGRLKLTSDYRGIVAVTSKYPISREPPRTDKAPYRENLLSISGMTKANGIRLILMTHATTWNSRIDPVAKQWHWMAVSDGVRFREELMDSAMEAYNSATRQAAAEQAIPLFDLAKVLPKSTDYFYDDVHFNVNGARTTAGLLAQFIDDRDLIPIDMD